MEGGYTDTFELICGQCGDHLYLNCSEIPWLQQILASARREPRTGDSIRSAHLPDPGFTPGPCPGPAALGGETASGEATRGPEEMAYACRGMGQHRSNLTRPDLAPGRLTSTAPRGVRRTMTTSD